MTNEQLYLAIGVPMIFNALLIALVLAQIASVRNEMASFRSEVNQRFNDSRDLWRAGLRRVEEVLDARL